MNQIDNRRGGRSRNRRAEILQAALELFAERGYRGTSLAVVADRIGLTQQGLLHYFGSKEKLLIEVLRLRDETDSRNFFDGGEPESLAQLIQLVAHNATQPGLVQAFTVLSAESVTDGHPAKEFFTERYADARHTCANAVADELDPRSGLTRAEAATVLLALMDGLQLQWLLAPAEVDMPRLFQAVAAMLRAPGPATDA